MIAVPTDRTATYEPLDDWPVDEENRGCCDYQGNQDQTCGIHVGITDGRLRDWIHNTGKARIASAGWPCCCGEFSALP